MEIEILKRFSLGIEFLKFSIQSVHYREGVEAKILSTKWIPQKLLHSILIFLYHAMRRNSFLILMNFAE